MSKKNQEQVTSIEKTNNKELSIVDTGGIEGIVGMTSEDINLPYMYLVRGDNKHAILANGSKAEQGSFYHSLKKTAAKELSVIIAYAEKGEAQIEDERTRTKSNVPAWRTLMLSVDDIYSPVVFTFKQMSLWYGFKPYLSQLVAEHIKSTTDIVVKLTSKEVTTKTGRNVLVPVISIERATTDVEKEVAKSFANKFGKGIGRVADEDLDSNEDRSLEDFDLDQIMRQ